MTTKTVTGIEFYFPKRVPAIYHSALILRVFQMTSVCCYLLHNDAESTESYIQGKKKKRNHIIKSRKKSRLTSVQCL
jgi:hypothetical protein